MPTLLLLLSRLRSLGPELRPLLTKRDTYYVAAIILLALAWGASHKRVGILELTPATRATVVEVKSEHVDKDVAAKTRRDEGKVKIVREYVLQPGGDCKPVLSRETEEREPVVVVTEKTTSTDRQTDLARREAPACPPAPAVRTWGVGGEFDLKHRDRGAVLVSKSFGDLTLAVGHSVGQGAAVGDVNGGVSIKLW